MVLGYGNVSKGLACMEGIPVVRKEDVLETCDIFVTATGNKDIIMAADMAKMKNNAIVSNIGHFDNEIDIVSFGLPMTIC